jgi:hypothetical protein
VTERGVQTPPTVTSSVWVGLTYIQRTHPARQVRVVRVLAADPVHVHALDNEEAKAVGHLCGASGTSDLVDASVVVVARRVGGVTVSSDPATCA